MAWNGRGVNGEKSHILMNQMKESKAHFCKSMKLRAVLRTSLIQCENRLLTIYWMQGHPRSSLTYVQPTVQTISVLLFLLYIKISIFWFVLALTCACSASFHHSAAFNLYELKVWRCFILWFIAISEQKSSDFESILNVCLKITCWRDCSHQGEI